MDPYSRRGQILMELAFTILLFTILGIGLAKIYDRTAQAHKRVRWEMKGGEK